MESIVYSHSIVYCHGTSIVFCHSLPIESLVEHVIFAGSAINPGSTPSSCCKQIGLSLSGRTDFPK